MQSYSLSNLSIGRALGRGRFGQVYEARADARRSVALKVLSKALLQRGGCEQQLEREIEVHSRLSAGHHPHVVGLLGYFEDEARAYLVMELAPRGALDRELRAAGRFEEPRAAQVVAALVDALHFAHSHGVAHRDIKPENVLLGVDGQPMLSDWGWAALVPDPTARRHTLAGSPEFAAPEVLDGSGHSTPADTWSLGVLAHELLTGRTPFALASADGALDVQATFARIREGSWEWGSLSSGSSSGEEGAPDAVSAVARDFVEACLRLDPAARPTMNVLLHHPWLAPYVRPCAAAWNASCAAAAAAARGVRGDDVGCYSGRAMAAALDAVAADAVDARDSPSVATSPATATTAATRLDCSSGDTASQTQAHVQLEAGAPHAREPVVTGAQRASFGDGHAGCTPPLRGFALTVEASPSSHTRRRQLQEPHTHSGTPATPAFAAALNAASGLGFGTSSVSPPIGSGARPDARLEPIAGTHQGRGTPPCVLPAVTILRRDRDSSAAFTSAMLHPAVRRSKSSAGPRRVSTAVQTIQQIGVGLHGAMTLAAGGSPQCTTTSSGGSPQCTTTSSGGNMAGSAGTDALNDAPYGPKTAAHGNDAEIARVVPVEPSAQHADDNTPTTVGTGCRSPPVLALVPTKSQPQMSSGGFSIADSSNCYNAIDEGCSTPGVVLTSPRAEAPQDGPEPASTSHAPSTLLAVSRQSTALNLKSPPLRVPASPSHSKQQRTGHALPSSPVSAAPQAAPVIRSRLALPSRAPSRGVAATIAKSTSTQTSGAATRAEVDSKDPSMLAPKVDSRRRFQHATLATTVTDHTRDESMLPRPAARIRSIGSTRGVAAGGRATATKQ